MVGCLYYEPPGVPSTVLIDPLEPPAGTAEAEALRAALDRDLARRGDRLFLLLGNHYHERSAAAIRDRYRASHDAEIWAHEAARGRVTCPIDQTFPPSGVLPFGVEIHPVEGLEEPETVFYLPAHRALVFADALLGTGPGRFQVPPVWWAPETPEGADAYRRLFRPSLRRLLDLDVEALIVSHGEPVLTGGRAALQAALDAPAWGE